MYLDSASSSAVGGGTDVFVLPVGNAPKTSGISPEWIDRRSGRGEMSRKTPTKSVIGDYLSIQGKRICKAGYLDIDIAMSAHQRLRDLPRSYWSYM